MPGFNKNILEEEYDDELDSFLEDDEDSTESDSDRSSLKSAKDRAKRVERLPSKKKDNKVIILGVCAVVVVISILTYVIVSTNIKKNRIEEELRQQELNEQLNSTEPEEDSVTAGIPNLNINKTETNDNSLVSDKIILKNLNNEPVEPNYKIREIKTVTDFINYEKFRASTGGGLEFYWLEAIYKDRAYKVQVPLSIYKELERKGITVVDAEVAVLEDGSQIVTYMKVRKDAKTLLEAR